MKPAQKPNNVCVCVCMCVCVCVCVCVCNGSCITQAKKTGSKIRYFYYSCSNFIIHLPMSGEANQLLCTAEEGTSRNR